MKIVRVFLGRTLISKAISVFKTAKKSLEEGIRLYEEENEYKKI